MKKPNKKQARNNNKSNNAPGFIASTNIRSYSGIRESVENAHRQADKDMEDDLELNTRYRTNDSDGRDDTRYGGGRP